MSKEETVSVTSSETSHAGLSDVLANVKVAQGLAKIQSEQADETADFYLRIMKKAASLNAVKINREKFLRTELGKLRSENSIEEAIVTTPIEAGFSPHEIDKLAVSSIDFEAKKCAAISTLAGIPGGLAMVATVSGDVAQYFMHVMRVEQKLAYLYGWQSFITDMDAEIDDETLAKLITLMGIMMGVGNATTTVSKFAATVAKQGVAKHIEKQALTKTSWYVPMKQVLRFLGVNVTKKTFANTASKIVPVVGGVVSGGITYYSFKPSAEKLRRYLRTLPLSGIDLETPDYEATDTLTELKGNATAMAGTVGGVITKTGSKAGEFIAQNAPVMMDGAAQAGAAVTKQASTLFGSAMSGITSFGRKVKKTEKPKELEKTEEAD